MSIEYKFYKFNDPKTDTLTKRVGWVIRQLKENTKKEMINGEWEIVDTIPVVVESSYTTFDPNQIEISKEEYESIEITGQESRIGRIQRTHMDKTYRYMLANIDGELSYLTAKINA